MMIQKKSLSILIIIGLILNVFFIPAGLRAEQEGEMPSEGNLENNIEIKEENNEEEIITEKDAGENNIEEDMLKDNSNPINLEEDQIIQNKKIDEENIEKDPILENLTLLNLEKAAIVEKEEISITEEILNENSEKSITIKVSNSKDNYIPIENITENNSLVEKKNSSEKIKHKIHANGEIQLEYSIAEEQKINIMKKENRVSEDLTEVKVYSDKHFENEVRAYADLPSEAKKENIKIYWKNENKNIEETIEYYDINSNGLYDRISWIVPHLSDQYFEITITPNLQNNSSEIELLINYPEIGQEVSNPIRFDFSINYSNMAETDCFLTIDNYPTLNLNVNEENTFEWNSSLANGLHSWSIQCNDLINNKFAEETGNFTINENFSVSDPYEIYSLGELVLMNINGKQGADIKLKLTKPDNSIIVKNLTVNQVILTSTDINIEGNYIVNFTYYNLSRPISVIKNFSVARLSLSSPLSSYQQGKNASLILSLNSPGKNLDCFKLNFGDGNQYANGNCIYINDQEHIENINQVYNIVGNYIPTANITIGQRSFLINSNSISITSNSSGTDTNSPKISLIYPEDDEEINTTEIELVYKPTDNIKLANCSLAIYNASYKSNGLWEIEDLVFPLSSTDNQTAFKSNPENNTEIKVALKKFDIRGYSWEVTCYDNSSNKKTEYAYFIIGNDSETNQIATQEKAKSYEQETEVKLLISKINEFMAKEKEMNSETKKVIEDLEIMLEITTYKNRLTQIDQDFKYNLAYISPESLKQERIASLIQEIREIKQDLIIDIEIKDSIEYTKNSLELDMEELVKSYMEETNTKLNEKQIEAIANYNLEIQKDITTDISTKKIALKYLEKTENIILISKQIKIENTNEEKIILEVIPENLNLNSESYNLISEGKEISEGKIYEFNIKDIEGKIIYYMDEDLDLEDTKKIDTLLFSNVVRVEGNVLTGFSISNGSLDLSSPYLWLIMGILVLLFLIVAYLAYRKIQIIRWRNEPNFRRLTEIISESRKKILINDLESARENYKKMREIYPLLPENSKPCMYAQIKIIGNAIDKRDILNLVREYEQARREFRKEDSLELYKKIAKVYERLPKKYKQRVYEKIIKENFSF